jgi:hypothetical protein
MFVCLVAMCAAGTVGMLSIAHAQVGKPEGLYYKSWAVVVGIENYLVAPKGARRVGECACGGGGVAGARVR